jgi:hypothetical protein
MSIQAGTCYIYYIQESGNGLSKKRPILGFQNRQNAWKGGFRPRKGHFQKGPFMKPSKNAIFEKRGYFGPFGA